MKVQTVAAKGQARATIPAGQKEAGVIPPESATPPKTEVTEPEQNLPTKSMTVKIDGVTYRKLKKHGVDISKTSQDIFVLALAMYFKEHNL